MHFCILFAKAINQIYANGVFNVAGLLRVFGIFFFLLVIGGCNVINVLKLRSANDDVVPTWSATGDHFPIKTDYIGEKVFIYGSINGVDGFKFLVDTGASFTILYDTPKVKSLGLQKGYELGLAGWGDEDKSLGHQINMSSFSFGDLKVEQFQGAFIQMSETPYFASPDELIYDGVIGHDLMRHFVWTFDYQAKQVTVANVPFAPKKSTQALPFDTFMSKISVEAKFDFGNGHVIDHDIIIDNGSRHYFKLSSAYPESNDVELPTQVTAADFGLSGKAEHQRITLPSITLGDIKLNKVRTNIIEHDDEDEMWVIGNGIFNQFVTTVDYQAETLYLTPYEGHEFQSRYNLMGLEVRKLLSGNYIVRYVMPDLPAKHAGLKAGDIIAQVNGVEAKNISKDRWLTMSNTPASYEICLASSQCVRLQSEHIEGYSR